MTRKIYSENELTLTLLAAGIHKCNKCGNHLDVNQFYKDKARMTGLTSICRDCSYLNLGAWREKNKEYVRQHRRSRYEQSKNGA